MTEKQKEREVVIRNLQHLAALIANYATSVLLPLSGLDKKAGLRQRAKQEFRKIIAERERLNSRFAIIAGEKATEVVDAAADRLEKHLAPHIDKLFFCLANNYLRHGVPNAHLHARFDTCGIVCAALDILSKAAHKSVSDFVGVHFQNRLPLRTLTHHISLLADYWEGQIPVNIAVKEDHNIQTGVDVIYRKLENVEEVLSCYKDNTTKTH